MAQKNIDSLLSWIILCEVTKKPFKIIKQELAFYIENSLPIPTKHPDQRHTERMDMRNPRKLYERQCTECQKDIITTYAPERPERVVCEECYRKLVY
jgi:formylmethanofuran dehydrogenase subunit E